MSFFFSLLFFIVSTVCFPGIVHAQIVPREHTLEEVLFEKMDIFPLQEQHVHGSTVVVLTDGDVLAGWFQGSGERWADDVAILGARLNARETEWSKPFVLADVPGFPDINPVLFLSPDNRLWLYWYTVVANQWETSLLKYRISTDFEDEGPPHWDWQEVLHVKPGDSSERGIQPGDRFVMAVEQKLAEYRDYLAKSGTLDTPEAAAQWDRHQTNILSKARGEDMVRSGRVYGADGTSSEQPMGYAYFRRMGWQTRNKPVLVGNRMLLPLYSDGFDFSLIAYTDDNGKTWQFSEPIVGLGNIQPALLQRKDGTLVAFMRDNGPPPKRLHMSTSTDGGETWSPVRDTDLPNPGSAADLEILPNGHWILIYNDTERGRHSLAVSISTDEGRSWTWTRHLERDTREADAASSHYPALVVDPDGILHAVYSFHYREGTTDRKTIRYARFNESWIMQGDTHEPD